MQKKLIFKSIIALIAIISPIVIAEIAFIIHHHYKFQTGLESPFSIEADYERGWTPIPLFNLSYKSKDYLKNEFDVIYSTNVDGFRMYGNPMSTKKKVLFIGDSFTHAREIEANKTFYGLFQNEYEVFAFGCSGYGPWQEYLLLKIYMNLIKPDLVVWQHHVNDLFDSTYVLDKRLGFSGFLFDRPYPKTTRFVENSDLKKLMKFKKLRLGHYLSRKYMEKKYAETETNVFIDLKQDPLLKQSLNVFQHSIDQAYQLSSNTKFMHFFVTHDLWFEKKLQEEVKFKFIVNEFSKYIGNSDEIKVDKMGHWNFEGHKRVHQFLAPLIRAQLSNIK